MRSELHCRSMLTYMCVQAVCSEVIHEFGKGDSLHWEDSDGMKDRWQHCLLVKNIMITSSVSYWVVS